MQHWGMSNERSETQTTDDTAPAAGKQRKSIRYRPDVDLALSAGFTEDEVRFMLDLPEDGEAR